MMQITGSIKHSPSVKFLSAYELRDILPPEYKNRNRQISYIYSTQLEDLLKVKMVLKLKNL